MPTSPEVVVAPVDDLAAEFARRVVERARAAVRERGLFTMAVPGGSVARAFLPALATAPIPWESTALFWSDERAVPPDDPDSNAGTARTLLAAAPAVARAQWYAIETARDLDACARVYSDTLVRVLGEPPVMDLILLGVGEDGHVASLFPGRAAGGAWAAAVHDAPKPPERRVTLTFETLAAARLLCIAALGKEKAEIVAASLSKHSPELPVTKALVAAPNVWVFLDPGAASQMRT